MEVTPREALEIAVSWLVPGFVLSTTFRLFVPFLRWEKSEAVLGYLSVGSLFATLRLIGVPVILTTLLLPALAGIILGMAANRYREYVSRLLPLPSTAWDKAFWVRKRPCFVVIVLKDGTIIRGIYGMHSLASSDPDRRDLFLEGVLVQDAKGRLSIDPYAGGLWIDGSQIVTIKFVVPVGGDRDGGDITSQSS